jgi:orotidine-5'-phosphate decarboxylase
MIEERERLIVALDVPSAAQARHIVEKLGNTVNTYKVGKQLFTAEGPPLVRELVRAGLKVFLDLKFHDIPNTVAGAVTAASQLGVNMLTVHASGGKQMLLAAVEAVAKSATKPTVLAVTVLTSLKDDDLHEIGVSGRVLDQALRLAALARSCGCGGIVASPIEARQLRSELGSGFPIVTPGVRPAGVAAADQARVSTPGQAIALGASHVVVGRPITESPDPASVANAILEEIRSAKQETLAHH